MWCERSTRRAAKRSSFSHKHSPSHTHISFCASLTRLRCSPAALLTSTRAGQLARHHHRTRSPCVHFRPPNPPLSRQSPLELEVWRVVFPPCCRCLSSFCCGLQVVARQAMLNCRLCTDGFANLQLQLLHWMVQMERMGVGFHGDALLGIAFPFPGADALAVRASAPLPAA